MKPYAKILLALCMAMVIAPVAAFQQQSFQNAGAEPVGPWLLDGATAEYVFELSYPNQVYRYRVHCYDATTLKIQVVDIQLPGDRWRATAYIYDKYPAKKVTTASGVLGAYSPVITMNNNGKTPLQVFVEVRYYRGRNDFSCQGQIKFQTNGTCTPTVTEIGLSDF